MRLERHGDARAVSPRLYGVLILLLAFLTVAVDAQETHTGVPRFELAGLLGDSLTPRILVLGTPHLSMLKGSFNRSALDSLLAHKPFVEAYLSQMPDLRLVQLRDLLK